MFTRSSLCVLICLASTGSFAADTNEVDKPYRYLYVSGPKLTKAPTIDGTVNPDEWAGAGMAPRLYHTEEDRLMDLESKFYFGYTDEAFYIGFQIQRPEDAIEPRAGIMDRDKSFWRQDDGIELWINSLPGPRPNPAMRDFYLMWNARGTHYDRRDKDGNLKFDPDWQSVCRTVPGYGWEGEVRLPFKEFAPMQAPKAGDEWRYDLMDNQSTPFPQIGMSGWWPAPDWSYYAKDDTFTRLRITGDNGVFVRVLESGVLRLGGNGGGIFEVVNPGAQPQKVAAKLRLYRKKPAAKSQLSYLRSFEQSRDKGGTSDAGKVLLMVADDKLSEMILTENYDVVREKNEDLTLNAGERKTLDFALADKVGNYLLLYEFRGADGKLIAGAPLPFIIPEPLEVKFANFFLVDKSVTAKIDLRYVPNLKKNASLEAKVFKSDRPSEVTAERFWKSADLGQKLDFKFPVRDFKPGNYTLHLTAKDAAGQVLAERKASITVPETPKWFAEKAGYAPSVPEPWTPIKVMGSGEKVSFLMGDYNLSGNALPKQVLVRSIYENDKIPILRAPITLKGKLAGRDLRWDVARLKVQTRKDEEVKVQGGAKAGDLNMSADVTFEYDGMAKIALTLAPAAVQKVEIDELYLEVPLKKEFSSLFLTGMTMQPTKAFKGAGKVPDEGLKLPFLTSVWLGNEERGFRWFSENMKGWHVGKKFADEAVEVLNGPDGATLKLNFIKDEKPFVLDKPRTITLAYMFTPPKTIRRDVVKLATTLHKEFEGKAGVGQMEVWYFKNQGWPEVHDDTERAEKLAIAKTTHGFGMKVTPYSGWFIPRASQVYSAFGGEMIVEPLIDGGVGCDVCCWNTPVQDAYTALFTDRLKDIDLDGFRLDAGFSADNCSSLVHKGYGSECGWLDDKGNLQPSKHLFAARRAAQRAYRLFHDPLAREGRKKDGWCIQHVHGGNRYDPILANMDAVLSVEGAEMMMKSLEELPLDFYRANVMGDAHGYQVVYLPKSRAMGTDSFYGIALLHNFTPRGGYSVAYNEVSYSRAAASPREIWRAREWIGPFDKGTEFWGYWKNEKMLDTGSKTLVGSFHVRRGEKLLLGILNQQRKPVEGKIKLDLKALGFGDKVYAFDPILGETVALDGGVLKLTFTPEGYRCIEIASKPFEVFTPEKVGANLIPEAAPDKWPNGGAPAGWQTSKYVDEKNPLKLSDADVIVKDGSIVLVSDGENQLRFVKHLAQQPGKFYMLEVEATIECDGGAFLGELPDVSKFRVLLGDLYLGHRRTMTSQPLPGMTQKFRLYAKDGGALDIGFSKAKGKAIIKKLELYEIKSPPPGFQFGKYGE